MCVEAIPKNRPLALGTGCISPNPDLGVDNRTGSHRSVGYS
jgi:hypothetical protein